MIEHIIIFQENIINLYTFMNNVKYSFSIRKYINIQKNKLITGLSHSAKAN